MNQEPYQNVDRSPAPGGPNPRAAHPLDAQSARFGRPEIAIVGLGVALRLALFLTGRTPLDGDEAIMGIMSYRLSRLQEFPIFFYGQHYMGTLEIPPVAALMALGPESWAVSVWPIRIVELFYFIALCCVHFKLASRFFGPRAARWSLFFLCVAPFYWLDFSSRLRHVVMMMFIGESMTLLALNALRDWEIRQIIDCRRIFVIGLLAGLAWWHYQAIVYYYVTIAVLLLLVPGLALSFFRRPEPRVDAPPPSPDREHWNVAAMARIAVMGFCAAALMSITVRWATRFPVGYATLIAAALTLYSMTAFACWRAYRSEKNPGVGNGPFGGFGSPASRSIAPALLFAGVIVGLSPSLFYYARLEGLTQAGWFSFAPSALGEQFQKIARLELSVIFDLVPTPEAAEAHRAGPRNLAIFMLFLLALYAFIRKMFLSPRTLEKIGVIYFLTLLLATIGFSIFFPRDVDLLTPRFFAPVFIVTSVMLGCLADEFHALLARIIPSRPGIAAACAALIVVLGSFSLWMPIWISGNRYIDELIHHRKSNVTPMSWPSGHEKDVLDIVNAMKERGIQRVLLSPGVYNELMGHRLNFAAGLKIYFRDISGRLGNGRLSDVVNDADYTGPILVLYRPLASYRGTDSPAYDEVRRLEREKVPSGGFWVDEFYFYEYPTWPPKITDGPYALNR